MKKEDGNKRFLTVSGVGALRWIDDIIYLCKRKAVILACNHQLAACLEGGETAIHCFKRNNIKQLCMSLWHSQFLSAWVADD